MEDYCPMIRAKKELVNILVLCHLFGRVRTKKRKRRSVCALGGIVVALFLMKA
jgi:hypothetical protein